MLKTEAFTLEQFATQISRTKGLREGIGTMSNIVLILKHLYQELKMKRFLSPRLLHSNCSSDHTFLGHLVYYYKIVENCLCNSLSP